MKICPGTVYKAMISNGRLAWHFKRKFHSTGYQRGNIALLEFALTEDACKEGWFKAYEMRNRSTNQGLVGVSTKENYASLIEVSCETDFVARNQYFQELVSFAAKSALNYRAKIISENEKVSSNQTDVAHLREMFPQYKLLQLKLGESKDTIQDLVESVMETVGENISFKRAIAVATSNMNVFGSAVHGTFTKSENDCKIGSYASLVVLKPTKNNTLDEKHIDLANKLAQHVIGMSPKFIHSSSGSLDEAFMEQKYLLDENILVKDLIKSYNCEIIDFLRYSVNHK